MSGGLGCQSNTVSEDVPREAPAGGSLRACLHCKEKAEWRFKDGWGVLACAEWFTGKCEGQPLDVHPPR